ncbi:recombinase RecT [Acinetobacter oleivorans]|uniref:recombinase RecT n=1 Tax=Acinetobacter oleivorans TaxID=1148157 RepID=UPI0012502FC2|nr:recombinase RecT [Acinetobacter oleivorans]
MNTVANIQPQQSIGLLNLEAFELSQRIAKMLSASTLVPEQYRAVTKIKAGKDNNGNWLFREEPNPNGLANCVIALNMASRLNADPLMVMQNLYLIEGRPSWSSQFIMAAINSCGRFSPLRFELEDLGEQEVEYQETSWVNGRKQTGNKKMKIDNHSCIAWALESGTVMPNFSIEELKEHGGIYKCCKAYGIPVIESSKITIEMAVKEGWYTKNGSKWQTMREQMLRYRAASFFGRVHTPELLMGLRSSEEEQERIIDVTPETVVVSASNFAELKRHILKAKTADEMAEIESQIYEVMDDKERNELIKLWKSKSEKSVADETVKKTDEAPLEPDPVVEVKEEVQAPDTSKSLDIRKKYLLKLNNAKTEKELADISREIEQEKGLTDTHRHYLVEVEQQRLAELAKKEQANETPKVEPIKSNGVKNGLIHQINEAQNVADLELVAKNITANKPKMTPEHHQETLTTYAQRKEVLTQEDMFAGVQDVAFVDAVIQRIQNAKNQEEINAEYADPAIDELSDEDRQRIDAAASQRESQLFG